MSIEDQIYSNTVAFVGFYVLIMSTIWFPLSSILLVIMFILIGFIILLISPQYNKTYKVLDSNIDVNRREAL